VLDKDKFENKSEEKSTASIRPQEFSWHGLVPGKSTVSEAIEILGTVEQEVEFANGKWFEFVNQTVQVIVLDDDMTRIAKIRVLADFPEKQFMPTTLDEVEQIYGPFQQTQIDEFAVITYERPGLRVACRLFGNPQLVKWLEFYPAC